MSKAPAKADVTVKIEPLKKLPPGDDYFSIRESSFRVCEVDVLMPIGHTFEDALRPEYWVNHAHRLARRPVTNDPAKVGSELIVRRMDHALMFRLYVRAVLERSLIVVPLVPDARGVCVIEPEKSLAVATDHVDLRWNVAKRGYDVVRKSDGEVIADGARFPTREMAVDWVNQTMMAA